VAAVGEVHAAAADGAVSSMTVPPQMPQARSPCTIIPAPACMLSATAVPVTAASHSPTAASRETCLLSPCACAAAMRGVVRNTRKEKM
jgi:hypothetical protein